MTNQSIDITKDVQRDKLGLRPIHPWFAVRPPSLGRAAAILTLLRSAEGFQDVDQASVDGRSLWRRAGLDGDTAPLVLDLFAGTSSIASAAAGLGCDADSVELNPVAYFIAVCAWVLPKQYGDLRPRDSAGWRGLNVELATWSQTIWEWAEGRVADAFDELAAGYVWSSVAPCSACGSAVDVIDPRRVAPSTSSVTRDPMGPASARADRACPSCGASMSATYLRDRAATRRLVAITDTRGEPVLAVSVDRALERADRAAEIASELCGQLSAPAPRSIDPELGTDRQAAVLLALADGIKTMREQLLAVGAPHEEVKALVACLSLSLSAVSPLGRQDGRYSGDGRFRCVRRYGRSRHFAFVEPGLHVWRDRWQRQAAIMTAQFERAQATLGAVRPHLGDAGHLSFPDESFDAVVCDPPYFDNIQYGDESEPFYRWLKLVASPCWPEVFAFDAPPRAEEVVAHHSDADPDAGSGRYQSLLRASVQEAIRVLRPDRCMSFIYSTRDPHQLDEFLRRAQPEGVELVDAIRVASEASPPSDTAEPWESYVLLLRKSRPLSTVHEPTVDAGRVLELAEKGRSKLYAAVADILEAEWDEDDLNLKIPPNFAGSKSQRIQEIVAGDQDPASLLAELGARSLRPHAAALGVPPELRRADATGLAEEILRCVGFTIPARPTFTVSAERAVVARCSVELAIATDLADVRGRFMTGSGAVERIVRHATVGWLQAVCGEVWAQRLEAQFLTLGDKPYTGTGKFTFGDWTKVFATLPRLQQEAPHVLQTRLVSLKRALGKRGAEQRLSRVVKVRNLVEHDTDDFLSSTPIAELRSVTAEALNQGVQAIDALEEAGCLPLVVQPLDEVRDRYNRLTLRTLDEHHTKVEFFVDAPTDLTQPYLWFPAGSNPREVKPVLLPLSAVRDGLDLRK